MNFLLNCSFFGIMLKKIGLQYWIIFAFIVGIISGICFPRNEDALSITFFENNKTKKIDIKANFPATLISKKGNNIDSIQITNTRTLIKNFESLKNEGKEIGLVVNDTTINKIRKISISETFVHLFLPFGTLFLRLLSFLAIPLVLTSLIVGVVSLGNIKKIGRIGFQTLAFYILTTAIAISIGLIVVNVIQPGNSVSSEARIRALEIYQEEVKSKIEKETEFNFFDFLVKIVPTNPFNALGNGEMLPIIFFAVFLGIGITFIQDERRQIIVSFFDGISDALIKLVKIVLYVAPFGVFALIATTISDFGISIIQTLLFYFLTVVAGYILHFFITYSILLKFVAKINFKSFLAGFREAFIVAFSTSSSAATLPVTFECTEENLGVPKTITSFVLPLGATINMDGTSLYQAVASVFIAQVYGLDLNFSQQLTILLTALLASIGTAPVPGVGLIMLIMVLQSVGLPTEGIALLLGVDRLLDMLRTILNVSGDGVVATCVYRLNQNKST